MVEISHINESYSLVENLSLDSKKSLANTLSPYVDNFQFNPRYRCGVWDGRIPFYKIYNNKFIIPKGLCFLLEKFFKKHDIEYSLQKTEFYSLKQNDIETFIESLNIPFKPYSYQVKCVLDSLNEGRLTNLSATGSGKSLIIYMITRFLLNDSKKVLIIVPNIMLVNQIYSDFESYGFKEISNFVQQIGGEFKDKEFHKPCVITTYQSQLRFSGEYDFDAIIVDECHGVGVESKLKDLILPKGTKAKFRFGFTGTLPKSDVSKLSVYSMLGKPNRVITAQGLINIGLATPVEIKAIFMNYNSEDTKEIHRLKNYQKEEKFINEHFKRNEVLVGILEKIRKRGNTLVLYSKLIQGDNILKTFLRKYLNLDSNSKIEILKELNQNTLKNLDSKTYYCVKTPLNNKIKDFIKSLCIDTSKIVLLEDFNIFCVSGEINDIERERIRQIMETHSNAIILATMKTMSTGVNIKKLKNLVFASSTKSEVTLAQSIGRIMRLHDSKSVVEVFDIIDSAVTPRGKENYFLKHFKERLNEYLESGYPLQEIEINL